MNPVPTEADILISLEFTKKEWTIIFNLLTRQQYTLAEGKLVSPITDKIYPHVATDSSDNLKVQSENGVKVN